MFPKMSWGNGDICLPIKCQVTQEKLLTWYKWLTILNYKV